MSKYRLDYITKFKPGTVEEMTKIRAKFVELEEEISQFIEKMNGYTNSENIFRTYDQALAHLEAAQMYAIFKPGTVEEMKKIRAKFVELEEEITQFIEKMTDDYGYTNLENIFRSQRDIYNAGH